MAYMSQSASPRSQGYANRPSPRKHILEEGPIKEFVHVIEQSRAEQWQKRTSALADLVAQIPSGAEYSRREAWFNSPPTLRHLHQPVGELLKDPRSTVVKRTCESLIELFAKCQGDAKYLFKDLMPVVLNVHAQTVQVIRNQVQTMVCEAIPVVPCKMVMPLWLDRLKTDKSRTVREACVLYLGMAIKHWTNDENGELGASYLSEDNWVQIGTALIKTLRDPSPAVRAYAKTGIATVRDSQPDLWDELIRDPDGPAGKDIKLQKWLIQISESGEEFNNDELSVASRFSHYSQVSKNRLPSTPSAKGGVGGGFNSNRPSSRGRGTTVPVQISVGSKQQQQQQPQIPRQKGRLGPPLRRPFAQAMDQNNVSSPSHPYGSGNQSYPVPQLGTPPRPPQGASPHRGRAIVSPQQQRSPSPSPRRTEPRHSVPVRSRSLSSATPSDQNISRDEEALVAEDSRSVLSNDTARRAKPTPESMNMNRHLMNEQLYPSGVYSQASSTEMLDVTKSIDQTLANLEMPNTDAPRQQQLEQQSFDALEEGPFIASMNELKEHASKRRSRRSITLQERWSRADSIGSAVGSPTPIGIPNTSADAVSSLGGGSVVHGEDNQLAAQQRGPGVLPEHFVIAEQLLRVHKTHVDQIMETLKIEMDTLRDFEQSLEQDQAPTPDQVLDYFESVGLCLDQRTTAGNILQREMDRISNGAFHQNANGINQQGERR